LLVVVLELPFVLEFVLVDLQDLRGFDPVNVPVILVVGALNLAVDLLGLAVLVRGIIL
jgi:hypothetical protein